MKRQGFDIYLTLVINVFTTVVFLVTITWSGRLAEIKWFIFIWKSQVILCFTFSSFPPSRVKSYNLFVQGFSCKISHDCRLKCSHLFFLPFLFSGCFVDACLICIVSHHCNKSLSAFCMLFILSSSSCIDVATLSWMLTSPLPPSFLDTYGLSTSSLGCKA